MAGSNQTRFHTLDALRGLAAMAVMLYHAGSNAPVRMPGGYLAADLFFVLSGFVLAHGYEERLRNGMMFKSFVRARLQRVYPVFWLGALLGCVLLAGSPLTIFMIPTWSDDELLFPANWPLWSLLFELLVNLVWAFCGVRLGTRALAILGLSLGLALFPFIQRYGCAPLGAFWITVIPGLIRTGFSFVVGLILYRCYLSRASQVCQTPKAWLLLPMLALVLNLAPTARAYYDMATIAIALPLIVWCGAHWSLSSKRLADWLGGLSFPLYCLHAPILAFAHLSPLAMTALLAGIVTLATLVDRLYDRPVQAWLKIRTQGACSADKALA